MKNIYTNILIDLDGTLTDSWVGITKSLKYGLSKIGISVEDEKELIPFVIGPPIRDSLIEMFKLGDKDINTVVSYYRERYSEKGLYENALHDGTKEMLQLLKSQDRNIYLATSKSEEYAREILKHFEIEKYFDGIYGATMDGTLVEKVDIIKAVVKNEGLDAQESIMIGDRVYDIAGAKEVGMDSVFFTLGYARPEETQTLKDVATFVVADMQELCTLFQKI